MARSQITQPQYSLEGIALLQGLPPESLAALRDSCSFRRYEPEEPIVEYLDRSEDVFFLVSGEARVIVYSLAGKVVNFHDLGPGDNVRRVSRTRRPPAIGKRGSAHELPRRFDEGP